MSRETYTSKHEKQEYEPLQDPLVFETSNADVLVAETKFDDPDLLQFALDNSMAIRQGEINVQGMSELETRRDGNVYKVYQAEGQEATMAGVVYVIKKGASEVELAYYAGQENEGRGIISASLAPIIAHYNATKDIRFDIHDDNSASIHVAKKFGAIGWGGQGGHTNYFIDKRRAKIPAELMPPQPEA